jgi:tricorn protease
MFAPPTLHKNHSCKVVSMKRNSRLFLILAFLLLCHALVGQSSSSSFLRQPSIGQTQIVFTYGHDLWIVSRQGGHAHPLTTGPGIKYGTFISPDGKWVAYTAKQAGISSVCVVPISGGVPRRLTSYGYSGFDETAGWTPDSREVLMRSARNSYSSFYRLFTVNIRGAYGQFIRKGHAAPLS